MRKLFFGTLVLATALAGCTSPRLPAYVTSRDTLYLLHQTADVDVAVGEIYGGPRELIDAADGIDFSFCGLDSSDDSDGNSPTYRGYIRQALIDELSAAGRYSKQGEDIVITGNIERLRLVRYLPFKANWIIAVRFASSNGAEFLVSSEYAFDVHAMAGPTVCNRAVESFGPAVNEMIERAALSPQFGDLLRVD